MRPILFIAGVCTLLAGAVAAWAWRSRSTSEVPVTPAAERTTARSTASAEPAADCPIRLTWMKNTGVDFVHVSGTSDEKPFPAANGSGIAAIDYDVDGWYDLYFATGTHFPIDLSRSGPINRMFRSAGGWQFADVTAACGLGHNGYSAGLAVGDFDSDGFPDVYVNCYGSDVLFHNRGDGTFESLPPSSGVGDPRWGTSAAFLDYDDDGLLDLYVCNYAKWSLETNQFCGNRAKGVRIFCTPNMVPPDDSLLLRNNGDGTFRDASTESGISMRSGRAQGVVAADLNNDGRIDLYVGNDLNANSLFLNQGGGRFADESELSGAAYDHLGRSQASMGVDAADVNRDGRLDLIVTNYESEYNAFYENVGRGSFMDVAVPRGLAAGSLPWVGWGTAFVDLDLDGWLDVIVTNGHTDENLHEMGRDAPYAQPPLVWRNDHGRFELVQCQPGEYFNGRHVGRALAVVDLDNDGDQDIVIGHQDAAPALLRNDSVAEKGQPRGTLSLKLIGTRGNRDAIGATVRVHAGSVSLVTQVKGGGSYLSTNDTRCHVETPGFETVRVSIAWPGQRTTDLDRIEVGQSYVLVEPLTADDEPIIVNMSSRK
jgi:hypothetical protein